MSPEPEDEWAGMVTVGRIVRPHGRRGEVVVESETDFGAERFEAGSTLQWLRGGVIAAARVVASRPYDARWVVSFEGLGSIEDAEAARGLELRVPVGALHPLAPGAYYTHDLVGCRVETIAGEPVGVVEDVMSGTGVPVLVLTGDRGEVLVPMVTDICRTIDTAGKRIVIDPPEGLVEANARGRRE